MDSLMFAAVAVGVSVAALAFYVGLGVVRSGERSGSRLASLQSREELLDTNFNERAVAPLAGQVGNFLMRFTPMGWAQRAEKRLAIAGWYPRIDANSWAAIRVVAVVGLLLTWFAINPLIPEGQRLL